VTQRALTVRLLAGPCWFLEPYCLGLEVCHPIIPIDGRRYGNDRPFADSDKAARHIVEIANQIEPVQDRIHIEKINGPFLFRDNGTPAEYGAGLKRAIENGWLKLHESGTFVTFTQARADLFA
jgi:hypothetical protein